MAKMVQQVRKPNPMNNVRIFAADPGSIQRNNFGWADASGGGSSKIEDLADAVVEELRSGYPVALGFECPLFLPVPEESRLLGKAREGEAMAYSASPGACATITGLPQLAWMLRFVHGNCSDVKATTDWKRFFTGDAQLFVWEAFVTSSAGGADHIDDARIAATAFAEITRDGDPQSAVQCDPAFSLADALIHWAGLSDSLLDEACLVVKP